MSAEKPLFTRDFGTFWIGRIRFRPADSAHFYETKKCQVRKSKKWLIYEKCTKIEERICEKVCVDSLGNASYHGITKTVK